MFKSCAIISKRWTHSEGFKAHIAMINGQRKQAMKLKDREVVKRLGNILSDINSMEIDIRGTKQIADELKLAGLYKHMMKERNESIKFFTENKRPELAEKEQLELNTIESLLAALPVASDKIIEEKAKEILSKLDFSKITAINQVFKEIDVKAVAEEIKAEPNLLRKVLVENFKSYASK